MGMTFAKIPSGTFMMGSPDSEVGHSVDESPQHQVTISKAFEMQTTEVTQSQWIAVMGSNPSYFKKSVHCPEEFTQISDTSMCPYHPVEGVNWDDALAFIQKLNSKNDGFEYRLATEAEWEYAARAGINGGFGGDLDAVAWHSEYFAGTHSVGKKQANAWGLYDVQGNVWEWTSDCYARYSSSSPVTDPAVVNSCLIRIYRGGGWYDVPRYNRFAMRTGNTSHYKAYNVGFRLLRARR
jgi:formylglycine-generating enzyme required for sulfatase activity